MLDGNTLIVRDAESISSCDYYTLQVFVTSGTPKKKISLFSGSVNIPDRSSFLDAKVFVCHLFVN